MPALATTMTPAGSASRRLALYYGSFDCFDVRAFGGVPVAAEVYGPARITHALGTSHRDLTAQRSSDTEPQRQQAPCHCSRAGSMSRKMQRIQR